MKSFKKLLVLTLVLTLIVSSFAVEVLAAPEPVQDTSGLGLILKIDGVEISLTDYFNGDGDTTNLPVADRVSWNEIQSAKRQITTDESKAQDTNEFFQLDGDKYFLKKGTRYSWDSFVNVVQNEINSSDSTKRTTELTQDLGIGADSDRAMDMLNGLVPIVNTLLGILVVLITLGLAVFTAFDVCYISFPVFRNKCEDQKAAGHGAMVKTTANGGTQLRFVSNEAQYVVDNCQLENGKNPITAYLGKRVIAYVAVTIVLFIFLTGNINIITNLALKVVGYVMNTIAGLQ